MMVTTSAAAAGAAMKIGGVAMDKIVKAIQNGQSVKSLADITRPARVEPLVVVEKSLEGQDFMQDVMKFSLTTFTGYYLQAITMVMNVGRIDTLKTLDALNPNRSMGSVTSRMKDVVFSAESYDQGLPSLEMFEQPMERDDHIVSVEARGDQNLGVDDETLKKFYEVDSLAVGKLVNVELKDGDHSAKLPVMIRLVPTTVPSKVLTHIFTATEKNSSFKERYHMWRSGQIRLVRDLMFNIDLIDQHRKALINDTSNVYMAIHDRRRNNAGKSFATGIPSMADASNIAVITKDTARAMARELYGKIDHLSVRKKIFEASYLMLLVVVDEQWERVTIYHRGIDQPTDVSFREIKGAEKGKGPDITEILKAYSLGSSPSI